MEDTLWGMKLSCRILGYAHDQCFD